MSIDIGFLAEQLGLEKAAAERMVRIFLDKTAEDLVQLSRAIGEQDTSEMARIAHHIKGAAANLELNVISEAVLLIEQQAKKGDLRGADQQTSSIGAELKALREDLSLDGI